VVEGLRALLARESILVGVEAADWRDAVRASGDALVAGGATRPGYTDAMIAVVETLGPYIVLAPGFALAHARPSEDVLRTGLSLVTLARPVEFGHATNDPVRLVVGLAATDHTEHTDALATVAAMAADAEVMGAIVTATSVDQALHTIHQFEGIHP
jgi:PTS system ascorbate-specific IIA component